MLQQRAPRATHSHGERARHGERVEHIGRGRPERAVGRVHLQTARIWRAHEVERRFALFFVLLARGPPARDRRRAGGRLARKLCVARRDARALCGAQAPPGPPRAAPRARLRTTSRSAPSPTPFAHARCISASAAIDVSLSGSKWPTFVFHSGASVFTTSSHRKSVRRLAKSSAETSASSRFAAK